MLIPSTDSKRIDSLEMVQSTYNVFKRKIPNKQFAYQFQEGFVYKFQFDISAYPSSIGIVTNGTTQITNVQISVVEP